MISRRRSLQGVLAAVVGAGHGFAFAQAPYPSKPITVVVPFPPGGGPDIAARVLGQELAPRLGQPFVVDNKPGAGALVGASAVARAQPDGYTLLLSPSTLAISPLVLPPGAGGKVDVQKDLTPIIPIGTTPMALVVRPEQGVQTLAELIQRAKANPGMAYGSPGNGSPMHFAGEMFKKSTGLDLLHVPYKGVAPSVSAALSGEVQMLFVGLGGVLPQIKAGKLIPLAIVAKKRSELLPEVPTATEQGVAGVEVNAWFGVFGPAGLDAAIVERLNREFNAALKAPEVKNRLTGAGIELLGGPPSLLRDFMKTDYERYGALTREFKIRAD